MRKEFQCWAGRAWGAHTLLAELQVKGGDDDYGAQAAHLLTDHVGGGSQFKALITQRERSAQAPHPLKVLLLTPEEDSPHSTINGLVLSEGLGRLLLPPNSQVCVHVAQLGNGLGR